MTCWNGTLLPEFETLSVLDLLNPTNAAFLAVRAALALAAPRNKKFVEAVLERFAGGAASDVHIFCLLKGVAPKVVSLDSCMVLSVVDSTCPCSFFPIFGELSDEACFIVLFSLSRIPSTATLWARSSLSWDRKSVRKRDWKYEDKC